MNSSFFKDQYILLNNNQLHYIEKPGLTRDTIIFIHGRSLSTVSWEKQFESEILSSYRLIALDLPGHGESGHTPDLKTYGLQGSKDLLVAFIEYLNPGNYILCGVSLGGHISLQSLPYLPGCKGVFSMTNPVTKPMQPELMYQCWHVVSKAFQEKPTAQEVKDYFRVLLKPGLNEAPTFIEESYYQTDPKIHEGILNDVIDGAYLDEVEVIRDSSVPIAVVAGIEDQLHSLSYLDLLELDVWGGDYQMVPAAGHLLQWENPDAVNTLLRKFASDCFD